MNVTLLDMVFKLTRENFWHPKNSMGFRILNQAARAKVTRIMMAAGPAGWVLTTAVAEIRSLEGICPFYRHKIQLLAWRDDIHAHAEFPILCPSHTTCSLLRGTFLPLFLLPLESLSKLLTLTWIPTDFPIFLFYPSTHKPHLGNSQFEPALGT